jgi:hypothetical protein
MYVRETNRLGRPGRASLAVLASTLVLMAGCASGSDDAGTSGTNATAAVPGAGDAVTLRATLTPDAVVPTPGPADGAGTAELTYDAASGQVCGRFELDGAEPLNIYVQQAPPGQRGPLVVRFDLRSTSPGSPEEQCGPVEPDRGAVLVANPSQAYLQVDTAAAPTGALRGQLEAGPTG